MTIRSKDNIRKVLDAIMSGASYKRAMELIGGRVESTVFDWAAKSIQAEKDGVTDCDFYLEWAGIEDFFHRHMPRARTRRGLLLESVMTDFVMHGGEEIVIENGKVCYALNEEYIGVTDDEMEALYGIPPTRIAWERIKRNDAGMPIALTRKTSAPATLRIAVLQGLLPEVFGNKVEHTINSHVPVLVVGGAPKPLALPPPGAVESELVRDLRARLAAGPKNPHPSHPVQVMRDNPNDPQERVATSAEDPQVNAGGPLRPAPATAPAPAPSYAKPKATEPVDRPGIGPGTPPPGGHRVA